MSERAHGTRARYKLDACRCQPCRQANSAYNKTRHRRIAYGTWQPYVDAEPVRKHISALRAAGLGTRRIATLAGVDVERVRYVTNDRAGRQGPQKVVRRDIADKILSVQLGTLPRTIDATGTHRRLQALAAAGWPHTHLSRQLGLPQNSISGFLARPTITTASALKIADLYTALELADPAAHGITERASTRVRNHAANSMWAPPACWDEDAIDDPDAYPEWTGECGTREGYRIHRREDTPTCAPCRAAEAEYRRHLAAA
jgi:hypothetical protein